MNEISKKVFEELNNVNINNHTETKKGGEGKELTFLSWCWAWAEIKKRYPDANYEVVKYNGIPYVYDEKTGYMVYTTMTIEGVTHEMWLPVMDSNNHAMKGEPYQVQTAKRTYTVNAATMFDVNKTIMRCLVKNMAMFGLGLYIYAGEDLPEAEAEVVKVEQKAKEDEAKIQLATILDTIKQMTTIEELTKLWNELTAWHTNKQFSDAMTARRVEIQKAQQQNTTK